LVQGPLERLSAALATTLVLGACGGGGGASSNPPPSVPSGMLDPAFAGTGKVTVADATTAAQVSDAVIDTSGSVYLIGTNVTKYGRDGVRDAAYGVNGSVAIAGGPATVDAQGNLYLVSGAGVTKLDASGKPVMSFGSSGTAPFGPWISGNTDIALRLLRDANGNLYVIGYPFCGDFSRQDPACTPLAISKLDANGAPVASFGMGGRKVFTEIHVAHPFAHTAYASVSSSAAVASDGSLYVADVFDAAEESLVLKLDASGNPATDFGAGGVVRPPCPSTAAIAVDAAGNVYLGGICLHTEAVVMKLDAHGAPVSSFGTSGVAHSVFPSAGSVEAIVLSNGSIYAGGALFSDFAVAKLDLNGSSVSSFGVGGVAKLDADACDYRVTMMASDGAGLMYLGGYSFPYCPADRSIGGRAYTVFRYGPLRNRNRRAEPCPCVLRRRRRFQWNAGDTHAAGVGQAGSRVRDGRQGERRRRPWLALHGDRCVRKCICRRHAIHAP
jgi:hypothetical protein